MVQVRTVACHFVNIVQRYCMLYQNIATCWYMVIGWIWHRNISDIRQKWIGSKKYAALWSNVTDNGYAIWANQNQHCAIHHYGSGTANLRCRSWIKFINIYILVFVKNAIYALHSVFMFTFGVTCTSWWLHNDLGVKSHLFCYQWFMGNLQYSFQQCWSKQLCFNLFRK